MSFFQSGRLIQELNHAFLTLVPKCSDATHLSDFRPISCCNTLYKFIAKILANRFQKVIDELISENQCVFIKDRLILDCTLLSYEFIRDFNKPMGSRACIKIDLRKAFDSVNREFVYHMSMGFPPEWINWIKNAYKGQCYSVMINGSPTGFFSSSRGIDRVTQYLPIYLSWSWSSGLFTWTLLLPLVHCSLLKERCQLKWHTNSYYFAGLIRRASTPLISCWIN